MCAKAATPLSGCEDATGMKSKAADPPDYRADDGPAAKAEHCAQHDSTCGCEIVPDINISRCMVRRRQTWRFIESFGAQHFVGGKISSQHWD